MYWYQDPLLLSVGLGVAAQETEVSTTAATGSGLGTTSSGLSLHTTLICADHRSSHKFLALSRLTRLHLTIDYIHAQPYRTQLQTPPLYNKANIANRTYLFVLPHHSATTNNYQSASAYWFHQKSPTAKISYQALSSRHTLHRQARATMETGHIDTLLERYLILLDEYTTLRERLTRAQVGMYQNIARANFSAERGVRYGPDYYDERMRASKVLAVSLDGRNVPRFEIVQPADAVTEPKAMGTNEARARKDEERSSNDADEASGYVAGEATFANEVKHEKEANVEEVEKTKKQKKGSSDPLRWFGILAPLPLRQAQTLSVYVVEDVIPRLVSVDAEMKDVEIEVRRARKRRAKTEAASKKSDAALETDRNGLHAPAAVVEST
ncbi:hypothetical protein CTA2_3173 [Colletotrichum tanaceti]|uniref:Vacuolar ATPase assembly protein VMA22 n=1 Tax=Colletotrichum tanaceti TaxID=1306861 RepID=A0A4V6DGA1_9PEZI|nr:hypothetical protein CTA2_3173 [Colletotrichum tanaceti]TKW52096.1 hypothetical protein CTA1_1752 [Colletotrichum tanaceti]